MITEEDSAVHSNSMITMLSPHSSPGGKGEYKEQASAGRFIYSSDRNNGGLARKRLLRCCPCAAGISNLIKQEAGVLVMDSMIPYGKQLIDEDDIEAVVKCCVPII